MDLYIRNGANLDYELDYEYYGGTHKAERIGSRYYSYDLNGNVTAERDGGHPEEAGAYRPYYRDGDLYWTDYGFGLVRPGDDALQQSDGAYRRNYKWNERNLLSESSDRAYTVQYRYGADGQRALKHVANSGLTTLYFNNMWQTSNASNDWTQSKHIYVGRERIATKYNSGGNTNTGAERERQYYYHSDHLGSAQTVTNWQGQVHERLEYTPYGELWIDWQSDTAPEDGTPFRFTGKELDMETGLYYYGARYLDPKVSRWLSGDPAVGEYVPSAPVNDEARKRNGNLPGMGGVFNYANLHVYHYGGNNPVRYVDPDGRDNRNIHAFNEIASRVLNAINNWTLGINSRTGMLHERAELDKETYNFLGKINMDSSRGIAFWWACAGGAVALRNRWITPTLNPNPLSNARDLANSGQINFYTDSQGRRITDPRQLGPLLQPGDVISYQSVNPRTGVPIDGTWHTATVLINDPISRKITYMEYHEDNPGNEGNRVEVWRSSYNDLGHYPDESLYGGGPWR